MWGAARGRAGASAGGRGAWVRGGTPAPAPAPGARPPPPPPPPPRRRGPLAGVASSGSYCSPQVAFMKAMRSFLSPSFLSPAKTIFVPGMYFLGARR